MSQAKPGTLGALLLLAGRKGTPQTPEDRTKARAARRQRVLKEAREALLKGDDEAADRAFQAYLHAAGDSSE
jgi:hypothetical protein